MPTDLRAPENTNLNRPDADEVAFLGRGVVSAIEPAGGLTELQAVLVEATFEAMTDHPAVLDAARISPADFAAGLAKRNANFRTRILQIMLLGALVLRPIPEEVADRVAAFAAELEVFAFIARANDDPRGFSLLAMVVSLFETGYLKAGAGLFEAFPGQLSGRGVAQRVADAMRRGALVEGSVDFLDVDWFAIADQPVEDLCRRFGVVAKSPGALAAGSVGPWQPGGISAYQWNAGQQLARQTNTAYDSFGATVAP